MAALAEEEGFLIPDIIARHEGLGGNRSFRIY